MGIKSIITSFIILIIFIGTMLILSHNTRPNEPLYRMKRIQERIVIYSKRTPEYKALYYSSLLNERLDDITYIYQNKLHDYIIPVNLRYASTAGLLAESVGQISNESLKEDIKKQLEEHKIKLTYYGETFDNKNQNARYFIDSSNYIDLYLGKM